MLFLFLKLTALVYEGRSLFLVWVVKAGTVAVGSGTTRGGALVVSESTLGMLTTVAVAAVVVVVAYRVTVAPFHELPVECDL